MKIVACIKYSLDVSEINVDPETEELKLAGVPKTVGNIDQNVLEAAVTLAETYGGEVHGLSYGPLEAKDAFRDALAMGLEDVTLVEAPAEEQHNPSGTALVLSKAVQKMGDVDLVVCGEVSDDGFTYQVPPRLAERLEIPQLSFAREIKIEEDTLVVERELDQSAQIVSAPLPALISVTEETNTPRRPTLMEAMQAKKKPVHIWDLEEDLGVSPEELEARTFLENVDTRGVVVHRKQIRLEGDDHSDVANQLVDRLIQDELLKGGE
jgi:electron transfer flavoprotein beta subunit